MSSISDRWKIQDELDEKYTFARMITSGELSLQEAEQIFDSAEDWKQFCLFLEEYRQKGDRISK